MNISIDFIKSSGLYHLGDGDVVDGNQYPSEGLQLLTLQEAELYIGEHGMSISDETIAFYQMRSI